MSTTQPISSAEQSDSNEIEIRLSDIVGFLKDSFRTVLLWAISFLGVGVLYALSSQNEYSATVRVMPELKGASGAGGLSDLKSLAGLAGVSLDNGTTSEAIRPDLYPDIIQSIPFTLHLQKEPVTTTNNRKPQSLQAFLTERADNSLSGQLGKLLGSGKNNTSDTLVNTSPAIRLTPQQEALNDQINKRIQITTDKKTGIMSIIAQMPDPIVAAIVAQQTLDYLTTYVTNYRTGKARQQVQFLSQQVRQAALRYKTAEYALSSYRDRNRYLSLETAKIDGQRLQADYLLAQTVYNDLSKQLEQARITVQEEVPVFQILEPARVPLHKSAPKRTLLVVGFTLFGAIAGLAVFSVRWFIRSQSTHIA